MKSASNPSESDTVTTDGTSNRRGEKGGRRGDLDPSRPSTLTFIDICIVAYLHQDEAKRRIATNSVTQIQGRGWIEIEFHVLND